jgi:aldehyde dehydrogenase (NAD+)
MSRDSQNSRRMDGILNVRHWDRLDGFLKYSKGTVVIGGGRDRGRLQFKPTVITNVSFNDALLREIFGPLLPAICYQTLGEALFLIKKIGLHPLVLYIMSKDPSEVEYMRLRTFFGSFLVNPVMRQREYIFPPHIGLSSITSYCGKAGMEKFSNRIPMVALGGRILPHVSWVEQGDDFRKFLASDLVRLDG